MSTAPVTDAEKGWLAGILDGEGCFSAYKGGPSGNSICQNISVYSSDWRLLVRIKDIMFRLVGRIIPVYPDKHGGWTFNVSRKTEICRLIEVVINHLAQKKPQAAMLHAICSKSWVKNNSHRTPDWVFRMQEHLQWYNKHKAMPDGSFVLSQYEKTRQSRAKPAPSPEGVTSRHGTPTGEGVL